MKITQKIDSLKAMVVNAQQKQRKLILNIMKQVFRVLDVNSAAEEQVKCFCWNYGWTNRNTDVDVTAMKQVFDAFKVQVVNVAHV